MLGSILGFPSLGEATVSSLEGSAAGGRRVTIRSGSSQKHGIEANLERPR